MGRGARHELLDRAIDEVARGDRRLDEIADRDIRERVRIALRLHRDVFDDLDPGRRERIRRTIGRRSGPRPGPTLLALFMGLIAVPAPHAVRALALASVLAGLVLTGGAASAEALPGDPLYDVKLAGERLRLVLAVSGEDRATVEVSIAEHRFAEASRLADLGRKDEALLAGGAFGAHVALAAAELAAAEARRPHAATLVAQLATKLHRHQAAAGQAAERLSLDAATAPAGAVLAAIADPAIALERAEAEAVAESAAAVAERIVTVASRQAALSWLEAEERRIGTLARPAVIAAVKRLAERAQEAAERARTAKDAGSRGTLAAGGSERP